MILIFGGETLGDFAFAMLVGVLSGTYSSIFIATPVLIAWKEREPGYRARAARIRELMGRVPAFPEDNAVARVGGELVLDEGAEDEYEGEGEEVPEPEPLPEVPAHAPAAERAGASAAVADEQLSPEEQAERERKRQLREERKKRRAERQRKHGRPR